MPAEAPIAEAVGLTRSFVSGSHSVRALADVSLTVESGEVVAVTGPSGSGKSTLLYLLGGLDVPDEGTVRITGTDWSTVTGKERAAFRRRTCGFVAQGLSLLPQATAAENVEIPIMLDGSDPAARGEMVDKALDRVGLKEHGAKLPDQLSGGEQQRVAIARALINDPALLLADEPTGNLDSETGQAVTKLLIDAALEREAGVVIVTHDPAVAAHAHRIVSLHSGRIGNGTNAKIERGAS